MNKGDTYPTPTSPRTISQEERGWYQEQKREHKAAKGRGRKPAHIGHYGTQDAIWQSVRELETFTSKQLICHINESVKVNDATVKSYLKRLENGGYLKAVKTKKHRGSCQEATYTLVKNTGVETPRLTKEGKPVIQGKGREQMWRAMKILGTFDWFELALHASTDKCKVSEAAAKDYCKILSAAQYLRTIKPGGPNKRARYRLPDSKYTGPRPPQIQRVKQLFDPNLDKVVWRRHGGEL